MQSCSMFWGEVSERGSAAALEEVVEELAVSLFLGRVGSGFESAGLDLRFENGDRGRDHGHLYG